jgi:hypothetical protein
MPLGRRSGMRRQSLDMQSHWDAQGAARRPYAKGVSRTEPSSRSVRQFSGLQQLLKSGEAQASLSLGSSEAGRN